MTQDEIIEMARQAGVIATRIDGLEVFAKLVADKEREACAKVCDDLNKSHWGCEVKATWCSEAIRARGQANG